MHFRELNESDSFEILKKAERYTLRYIEGKKHGKGLMMDKIKRKKSKHGITKNSKKYIKNNNN